MSVQLLMGSILQLCRLDEPGELSRMLNVGWWMKPLLGGAVLTDSFLY